MNLSVFRSDVCSAFLNSFLDEEIYLKVPDGVDVEDRKNVACAN